MKKYFLILFLSFSILMPGVKAECNNLLGDNYKDNIIYNLSATGGWNYAYLSLDGSSYDLPLELEKTYTFFVSSDKFFSNTSLIYNGKSKALQNLSVNFFTFTLSTNSSIKIYLATGGSADNLTTYIETTDFYLIEGDTVCDPSSSIPDEPDPPFDFGDQPSIISNFYSICLDKINFLATSFSENYILFCIPVISIFVFVFILIRRFFI